jgi:hypothetical protein
VDGKFSVQRYGGDLAVAILAHHRGDHRGMAGILIQLARQDFTDQFLTSQTPGPHVLTSAEIEAGRIA